jgi:hypothetical protein
MSVTTFIASQSAIWIVTAFCLIFVTYPFLVFFGHEPQAMTAAVARVFGAELTGLALVSYFTRHTREPKLLSLLTLSYTICNTLGFAISLHGVLTGALNPKAWALVGLYLVYAVGFAYFRFIRRPATT